MTDGTGAGTVQVSDIANTSDALGPRSVTGIGNRLYFAAEDQSGEEPWVSDGTEAGTERMLDVYAGGGSSSPYGFIGLGDAVYFTAAGPAGFELYRYVP
jgi:ELWxxDGT repeat protein